MQGCLAPSEIPGIGTNDASVFGGIAEDLIYSDFYTRYAPNKIYCDHYNPSSYLWFLASNNPHFVESAQRDMYTRLKMAGLPAARPDIMIHAPQETAFYEIKPDSKSGMDAGMTKVGILSATYRQYRLPYRPGMIFSPKDHVVAQYGRALTITLKTRLAGPGLVVYKLCIKSDVDLELATIILLLTLVVKELIKQRGNKILRPVDLLPVLQRLHNLKDLAVLLGRNIEAQTINATWRHFWKAVVKRFAVRGAAAATLSAADGPLPIGELISLGLAVWTIVDIVRLSDELWQDARMIANSGA